MIKHRIRNVKGRVLLRSFILRFAIFSAAWLILIGGQQLSDIVFVILFLALTTVMSIYSVTPGEWDFSLLGIIRFFPYFIITALRGGWDVARRVFFRTIPIDPDFITIQHDRHPQKTLILAWIISLLPGTASCVITEDTIVVHVLDKRLPVREEIQELQKRINAMFKG
jgi:multicomponent Na+:H+ antiporter subunit E